MLMKRREIMTMLQFICLVIQEAALQKGSFFIILYFPFSLFLTTESFPLIHNFHQLGNLSLCENKRKKLIIQQIVVVFDFYFA